VSEDAPPGPPADTVPCVVCREGIRCGAALCIHCKSPQGWTRHLARWSAIVAAVVGLSSLVTGAVSLAKLVPADAQITAIPIACSREAVKVALGNAGDKAGVADSISLQIDDGTAQQALPVVLSPKEGDAKPIIGGRQSSVIVYEYRVSDAPAPLLVRASVTGICKYRLTLNAVDFAGKKLTSAFECGCPSS